MLRHAQNRNRDRRGATLPIVLMMLVVLIGMLAFSVDTGRTAVCHIQLRNAADSAALAGASALGTDNLIKPIANVNQTVDIATAQTLAQKFGQANSFDLNGAVKIIVNKTNDVQAGYLSNPSDLSGTLSTTPGVKAFNSVRVATYADSTHGGAVSFLFAPVLGQNSTTLQTTATATVELHSIVGIKAVIGAYSPILPITMSYSDWQQMVNNQTGIDSYIVDPSTGQVSSGSDGLQEQQLYPGSNGTSSNNGLLQFGTGSHSNSVLYDQIVNGPTSDQMSAQWPPSGVTPWDSQHHITIGADPGWRATNFDALSTVITNGQPRLIPINDGTSPGNGANGSYTIVAFAPVRVVSSNKGGKKNGSAYVQAAVLTDPSLIAGGVITTPGQGGMPVVRLTR